jgi:hypothetical protein
VVSIHRGKVRRRWGLIISTIVLYKCWDFRCCIVHDQSLRLLAFFIMT